MPSPLAVLAEFPAERLGQEPKRRSTTRLKFAAAQLPRAALRAHDQVAGLRIGVVGKALVLRGAGFLGRRRIIALEQMTAGLIDRSEGREQRYAIAPSAQSRRGGGPIEAT